MGQLSLFASENALPRRAGVGLKAGHYRTILDTTPDIGFFEVHAENYMGAGGAPHRYLAAVRERYPLSMHGVGMSIGSEQPLDRAHLAKLRLVVERHAPAVISEHLAWSSHDGCFLNDLLPIPYTMQTLVRVRDHVDEIQDALGRQILLENPSTYVAFAESTFAEADFIGEIVRRTGCGMLLDVNNVYVASVNQRWDPRAYIDACPLAAVGEIHLAGHNREADENGWPLLVDTHDRPVAPAVWDLFAYTLAQTGPVPTLIEWDANVPSWPILASEADHAGTLLLASARPVADPQRAYAAQIPCG